MTRMFKNYPNWYSISVMSVVVTYLILLFLAVWSNAAKADESKGIVTIDGSITEIIYELGMGHHVIGRDITSNYPKEVNKLPSVGYMRTLSSEGILSLRPKLVIATKDAKPQSVLRQLRDAGVKVELIDNEFTLEGVKTKIKQVAAAIGKHQEGHELAKKVEQKVLKAGEYALQQKEINGEAKAIFLLGMRGGNMNVAGRESRAHTMFELAHIHNPAAEQFKGYKPLTAEAAIQYNPAYIITMSHGLRSAGGKKGIFDSPAVKMTEAGQKQQLIVMDNGFLTFGPRLGQSIEDFVDAVYGNKTISSAHH